MGERIKVIVKYTRSFEYTDYKFSYYGTTHYTHLFKDAEGYTYVWKTTNPLDYLNEDDEYRFLIEGSKIELTGTVKEVAEYKGNPQTVLTRCRFTVIELGKTKEQIQQERKEQVLASVGAKDFIWTMPYRQYKEHYSDCETIPGSFDSKEDSRGNRHGQPTIDVIIREGRLKASGTRGKHYSTWIFEETATGKQLSFYAISEETATRQLVKAGFDPSDYKDCYAVNY